MGRVRRSVVIPRSPMRSARIFVTQCANLCSILTIPGVPWKLCTTFHRCIHALSIRSFALVVGSVLSRAVKSVLPISVRFLSCSVMGASSSSSVSILSINFVQSIHFAWFLLGVRPSKSYSAFDRPTCHRIFGLGSCFFSDLKTLSHFLTFLSVLPSYLLFYVCVCFSW